MSDAVIVESEAVVEGRGASTGMPGKWMILAAVVFGVFMVVLDGTVVNVAFQRIRLELGATLNDSQWIISVYVLALGISTPVAGFLADRFGTKRVFLWALGVFSLGSLLCGLASNLPLLIAARALQGIGGGIALPLSIAFIFPAFPASEQGLALGIFGVAALTAPAVGPLFGGYLVDQGLWRYIFFINPPIGIIGIFMGLRFLPEFGSERKPPLDVWGLITEIIGFGAVLYAATLAASKGWTAPEVLLWFGVGVVGLVAFGVVELFIAKEPLLDLRLFKKPLFTIATLIGYVSVVALFGAEFLLPIYLQELRGLSAFTTGLVLLPLAIVGAIVTITAGRLYDLIGPRVLVTVGYGVLVINTWQLAQITADTSIGWIIFLLILRGVALGCTLQTSLVTSLSVVPMKEVARASSLSNATRQVVQSIGVAVLASVLASTLSPKLASLQEQFLETPQPANAAPIALCSTEPAPKLSAETMAVLKEACTENVAGFERAYTVTFYAALASLALGLFLPGWPFKWGGRRAADAPVAMH
jgi:EmrB/QacA subfamily drug resistance transporter